MVRLRRTLSKSGQDLPTRVASYLENSKVEYQSYWINTILVESSNKAR